MKTLLRVTKHFVRNDTQVNCTEVDDLCRYDQRRPSIKKGCYTCVLNNTGNLMVEN